MNSISRYLKKIFSIVLIWGTGVAPLFSDGNQRKEPLPAILRVLDQPVFVVTQNHFAEGFEADSAKFGDLLMIEIIPAAHMPESKKDYKVGKEYPVLFGGEVQGTVRVDRIVHLQCDSYAAKVKVGPSIKIRKNSFALATQSKTVKSHPDLISNLSGKEKTRILRLVVEEFRKRKVEVKALSDIRIEDVRQTKFEPDALKSITPVQ